MCFYLRVVRPGVFRLVFLHDLPRAATTTTAKVGCAFRPGIILRSGVPGFVSVLVCCVLAARKKKQTCDKYEHSGVRLKRPEGLLCTAEI